MLREAKSLSRFLSREWDVACEFPVKISPEFVQKECDRWCERLTDDRGAAARVPAPLRPLILARCAAAVIVAEKFVADSPTLPDELRGFSSKGGLRFLLTVQWRNHILPNWQKITAQHFSE